MHTYAYSTPCELFQVLIRRGGDCETYMLHTRNGAAANHVSMGLRILSEQRLSSYMDCTNAAMQHT